MALCSKKLKIDSAATVKSYQTIVKALKVELKQLKAKLDEKLRIWHPELVEQVSSVKEIGPR